MQVNVTNEDMTAQHNIARKMGLLGWEMSHMNDDPLAAIDAEMFGPDGNLFYVEFRNRPRLTGQQLNMLGGVFINCEKLWTSIKIARNADVRHLFVVMDSEKQLWGRLLYSPKWSDSQTFEWVQGLEGSNPQRRKCRGQERNDSCFAYKILIRNWAELFEGGKK